VNHYINKKWILKADELDLIPFHFTMADNPTLEPSYVAMQERAYAGVFYDRMIKGLWTNAAGAVYPMWDPAKHVLDWERLPKFRRIIGTGIDFGTSNASAGLMLGLTAEDKPRLVLLDEWRYDPSDHHDVRLAPSEQAQRFKTWLGGSHAPQPNLPDVEYNVIDPAAAHFAEELQKAGIYTWAGDNDVLGGISTISRLLQSDQFYTTTRTPGWNAEVTEYQWDPKATEDGVDQPIKTDDHSLDAGRYITHTARGTYEYELAA